MTDTTRALLEQARDALDSCVRWFEAEEDHSKEPNFYARIDMCRRAEEASREGFAAITAHLSEPQPAPEAISSAACERSSGQDAWQPIETVPMDGGLVQLTNDSQIKNCYWDGAMHRNFPWRDTGGNGWMASWPTHWRRPGPSAVAHASQESTRPDVHTAADVEARNTRLSNQEVQHLKKEQP